MTEIIIIIFFNLIWSYWVIKCRLGIFLHYLLPLAGFSIVYEKTQEGRLIASERIKWNRLWANVPAFSTNISLLVITWVQAFLKLICFGFPECSNMACKYCRLNYSRVIALCDAGV